MAPRSLRKTFLGCKTGKRLGEDVHLKWAEEKNYSCKFSKVNALRKGRLEAYGQEETFLFKIDNQQGPTV